MRILLLLLLSTAIALAEPRLLPIDEGAQDENFSAFRKSLIDALEHRDVKFIESLLTVDALASFGDEKGVEGFHRIYGFRDPGVPFWSELGGVLRLGGTFVNAGREFAAPYVTSRWPEKFEPFEYVVLLFNDVAVHAAANAASTEITRLSYSILKLAPESNAPNQKDWVAIHLPAGSVGFVPATSIRSPLNYRAQFRREGRTWKLVSFLAGD